MDKLPLKVKEPSMLKDDPARADRLAEALRANLRRRKAQARAVEAAPASQASEASAAAIASTETGRGGTDESETDGVARRD